MVAFGGQKLSMQFGDVEIEVAQGGERFRWTARVQFFEFSSPGDESLVLGHAGFLDYFTATFDGARSELILVPNEDLPTASTEDRDVGR